MNNGGCDLTVFRNFGSFLSVCLKLFFLIENISA